MRCQELDESFDVASLRMFVAALSSYVTPVVATVGGVLVLGEAFTGVMLAGIGLISRHAARQPSLV